MTLSNERKLVDERDELVSRVARAMFEQNYPLSSERSAIAAEHWKASSEGVRGAFTAKAGLYVDAILPGGYDAAVERGAFAMHEDPAITMAFARGLSSLALRAALGLDGGGT